MKKIYLLFVLSLLFMINIFAQTPEKLSYQAVIRDNSDAILASQNIGMQLSILEGSASGTAIYVETQSPTTNMNGLLSLEIGMGTLVSGDFTTIDWGNNTYFIKTEIDITGGTNYTITGTSQLLSVPYALYAKTAETVTGSINETDPNFTAWNKDYADLINTPTTITTGQASAITANTDKNTYPAADATKLAGIEEGAEINVQADWNQATTTADDYIKNKPTIPAVADGSETKVAAGTNVTVTGTGTTASPYVVTSSSTPAEYAYGHISGNVSAFTQNLQPLNVRGLEISNNQVHLNANKTYLITGTMILYNYNEINRYAYVLKNVT